MVDIVVQPLRIFVPKEGFSRCLDENKEDELYKKLTGKSQMAILENIAEKYSASLAMLAKRKEKLITMMFLLSALLLIL